MSVCDVDFSDVSDDADPVGFFERTTIKRAKKDHICDDCCETIPAGASYERISYRFEGEFTMDRICANCRETAGEFSHYVFGGLLWPNFEEQWDSGSPLQACLNRLSSASAKAHMHRRWQAWQEKRAESRRRAIERRKPTTEPHP